MTHAGIASAINYKEKNNSMGRRTLKDLMATLSYYFNNRLLLKSALKHRSLTTDNNERLEFLGDAILNAIISKILFDKFANAKEGQLSRLRAVLVNEKILAEIARSLQLGEYIYLGQGEIKNGGKNRDSILADAFEAIIGAIYVDSAMEDIEDFIKRIFNPRIANLSLKQNHKDAKTSLQEYLQALKQPLPSYCLEAIHGKEHNQRFVVSCQCVLIEKKLIGEGTSKRKAEQQAAKQTLEQLQNNEQIN